MSPASPALAGGYFTTEHLGSPAITPWFIKLEEMFQITCLSRQEALVELPRTLGYSEGQGSLACFSPWGHKESDVTE